ncbi:pimeloyl-ACP methyl ester carboxylesterase [Albidovulum inexpectatum]|uniref:Pimeloyl-ACP methyl ester carboxylesterase n=1 Tax=Albidovulum inexpectatum TaxID=196587 RepID=A0A2S5JLC9_9RHOB|nr:alpha/beta fold hydrolase [Albidovulum inexpectatum]PPB82294.1 pimeloyl-ACP methyl ester carboxylesterase [Albidovulum inexpectatum]
MSERRLLLVHGSCHGAWCWDRAIPELAARGLQARAIDLPAHGADRTPPAQATLDLYVESILKAIDAPVTLVGHSAAGYPVTIAAERAPHLIDRLVYVCAYVPRPGLSMIDMRRAGPRQPLAGIARAAPDGVTYSFDPTHVPGLFYHDCPPEDASRALELLCPEPIAPQATPCPPLDRVDRVRRHYILCEQDRVIPPEYQADMAAAFGSQAVTWMNTGHSPFFADPRGLAEQLAQITAAL